jgi:hypothetical protein
VPNGQHQTRVLLNSRDHLHDRLHQLGSVNMMTLARCELSDAPANGIAWSDADVDALVACSGSLLHLGLEQCSDLKEPRSAFHSLALHTWSTASIAYLEYC